MIQLLQFSLIALAFLAGANAFAPLHPTGRAAAWGVSSIRSQRSASSVTIEQRESSVKIGGGPAVLDRPQETVKRIDQQPERTGAGREAWEVRIYNDGMNTREHVARSLVQVTGMSEMVAYQTMMQAHQNGIAVVGRWVYEVAEMYHEALKKNGIVCDLVPVDEE
jgi:ATP-dependent Clp protease adaptor protein ClpS